MYIDKTGRNGETPGGTELGAGAAAYGDLLKPGVLIEQADVNKMKSDQGAFEVEGLDVQAAQARALETQHFIPEAYKRRIYDLGAQFATWEEAGKPTYHSKVHIAAARWIDEQFVTATPPGGELPPGEAEYIMERSEDMLVSVKAGINTAGAPFRFEQGKLVMVSAEGQKVVAESDAVPETKPEHDPETDRIIALIDQRKALRRQADQLRVEALQLAQRAGVLELFPKLKLWLPDARRKGLVGEAVAAEQPQPEGDLDGIKAKISALEQRADGLYTDADALTKRIMADVPRFPPNPT